MQPLGEALDDPVPLIRSSALRALVRLRLAEDARARLKALVLELLSAVQESDAQASQVPPDDLIAAAGLIDDQQIREGLHEILRQGPEQYRSIVAHELAKFGDDLVVPQLVADLANLDPAHRLSAANDLLGLHVGQSLGRIRESLQAEQDVPIRKTLAMVLARAGETQDIAALLAELGGQINETGEPNNAYPFMHELIVEVKARGPFPSEVRATFRRGFAAVLNPDHYPPQFMSQLFDATERITPPPRPVPTDWKPYPRPAHTSAPAEVEEALADEAGNRIKTLDPKTVGGLVSTLIADELLQSSFAANDAVNLVRIRPDFVPDVPALFQMYLQMKAPNYQGLGMLPVQLAWILSRLGTRETVKTLKDYVVSPDAKVRLAAVDLIGSVAIYANYSEAPYMIGGMGPGGGKVGVQEVSKDLIRWDQETRDARTTIWQMPARPQFQASTAEGTPAAGALGAETDGGGRVGSFRERHDRITKRDKGKPTRSAYPLIECPSVVVAQVEFELTVGIAAQHTPEVVGGPMEMPTASYVLSVQVFADGFALRAGESSDIPLPVTDQQAWPTTVLHLTAQAQVVNICPRTIRVLYSVDGQTIGAAFRPIAVVLRPDLIEATAAPTVEPGLDLGVPTAEKACDLTLQILMGQSSNIVLVRLVSPHDGVSTRGEPIRVDIGNSPELLARQLVDKVNLREGKPGIYELLLGFGGAIADKLPGEFWRALRAIREKVADRPPTILILSEEPYVPWELAVMDDPLIDSDAPPFLGAQADVGRWIVEPRVRTPPQVAVKAQRRAVISGVYARPGWKRLREAEDEASQIQVLHAAIPVTASTNEVLSCLKGKPLADLIHFAVHGIYDRTGTQDGLVLTDGAALDPMMVRGSRFATMPFVFLNACQVGSGNRILGDYAGMAAAFIYAGAASVVAPLWSIKDTVAKDVALRFYTKIASGSTPASVFRVERARMKEADASATYLAYLFFGHPTMRLAWTADPPGDTQ